MYQDIRLFLNETDITDQVVFRQRDLDIRQKFRDYRATIGLVIPSTSTISIKPSNEVKVKYTNTNNETKTLFGGIIFNLEYGEMTSDGSIEVMLDCEGFYPSLAGRRTITNVLTQELNPPIGVTEADWMYYAGYLAASYVDKFLSQDGVSIGHVEAGRLLAATELEEFVTMSIKEIYDVLAEPSGHSWWIDNDKVFHFGALLDFITYSAVEDTVSIGNGNFTVKGCSLDLSGFINKVFIEGSDDWDAEVPPEHQDIYGRILYIKENTASINKLSLLNGNTGVFGSVLRDGNIMNLETAQYRADKILSLYPDIPYQLRVDTFDDRFKPGDKLPVNLPFYGINNELFTIHDINIEMATGKKPIFHMVLSNVPELGGTENLYQYFDQIGQKITPSNQTPITYPTTPQEPTVPDGYTDASYFTFDPATGTITGYSDFGPKKVIIPPQIDGVDVVALGDSAFKGKYLTSVNIPFTVRRINSEAFYNNKLTSVIIPDSVWEIQDLAFAMNHLTSAILGNSVQIISISAFQHNKLNRVAIPKATTYIGMFAFTNNGDNGSSDSIPIDGPWRGVWAIVNDVWTKDDSMYTDASHFMFDEVTGAITGMNSGHPASLIVPPVINNVEVTNIGPYGLSGYKTINANGYSNFALVENIVLPDTVKTIEDYGAANTSYASSSVMLKMLQLSPSVETIGRNAFQYNNLYSLTIPDNVLEIGTTAFSNNVLSSVKLGNGLARIPGSAFRYNNLTSITIPNSVTSIGNYAFSNNSIKNLELGENVYAIESYAFQLNKIKTFIIPDTLNKIERYAFYKNEMENIHIPSNVLVIEGDTFAENPNIEFTVSATNPNYSSLNGSLYTKDGGTLLVGGKSGIIADGTLAIGIRAFKNYGLESVVIPTGVATIGTEAFRDNNLTNLIIPDGVIAIGYYAFVYNNLNSIVIPDGVTTIGVYAFVGNNLTSVTLPNSITDMDRSFYGYTSEGAAIPFPTTEPADGWGGTWVLDGTTWIKQS